MRLLQGLLAIGVSSQQIPLYGPTRGDRCLSPGENETSKYSMQYSHESQNVIEEKCRQSSDCDIVVMFSKPQFFEELGYIDQTHFEMGSTQSRPCTYKSSKVQTMEVVFTKKGSQLRANQVPSYGPVGNNNCLHPGDRPYENYSMLKNYESLSLAKKYCNLYENCDIIVEIDRTQVMNRSLRKLYEIGDTRSRNLCEPRLQRGVKVQQVSFSPNRYRNMPIPTYAPNKPTQSPIRGNPGQDYISNENEHPNRNTYNQGYRDNQGKSGSYGRRDPKRRETIDFQCLQIGKEVLVGSIDNAGCAQVFDTISTANLACSLFEQCVLIGKNSDGNFELFSESEDKMVTDLTNYDLSIPTMEKSQSSLIYDFTTILNHENMAITQITAYDPISDLSIIEVPKHGIIPESTHLIFYDKNLSVVIQENTCVIKHPEPTEKLTTHIAATIDYKLEKQHGNLDVDRDEYAISDLSIIRDELPLIARKHCFGKTLVGLDFDLKGIGHEKDDGSRFFFMNETEHLDEQRLPRSRREDQRDPVTGLVGTIIDCNGDNACGSKQFMAATCSKESCGTLFCQFIFRGYKKKPGNAPDNAPVDLKNPASVIEAPYVSWNHIIKAGYWCMPCCILPDDNHPKMKQCSEMPTQKDICKQNSIQGRCGIDFQP